MAVFMLCDKNHLPPKYDAIHEFDASSWTENPEHFKDFVKVETYRGRVLSMFERNGYDDSDFYAVVWSDEQNKPINVEYATTRGWTYANGAQIDATDETRAKYENYIRRQQRMGRIAERNMMKRAAHEMNLDLFAYKRLLRAYPSGLPDNLVKLMKVKKFRSNFRANLCKQVRDWCAEHAPKYVTPLSAKQLWYI